MAHIMMLGGDRRSRELYHLLRAKHPEHTVDCMGLWEWEKSAAERNADIWILPFPSFRGELPRIPTMNGILGWSMEETAAMIPQGAKVICGLLPGHEHFAEICPAERIDLLKSERYQQKNAALTAEGAVSTVSGEDGEALWGKNVLIVGYGRIGRRLAPILRAVGTRVTVAARRASVLLEAADAGFRTVSTDHLAGAAVGCDVVFNTVPARLMGDAFLHRAPRGMLYVELASQPYGADPAKLESMGIRSICLPGIPGVRYPRTAARILLEEMAPLLISPELCGYMGESVVK